MSQGREAVRERVHLCRCLESVMRGLRGMTRAFDEGIAEGLCVVVQVRPNGNNT